MSFYMLGARGDSYCSIYLYECRLMGFAWSEALTNDLKEVVLVRFEISIDVRYQDLDSMMMYSSFDINATELHAIARLGVSLRSHHRTPTTPCFPSKDCHDP